MNLDNFKVKICITNICEIGMIIYYDYLLSKSSNNYLLHLASIPCLVEIVTTVPLSVTAT